MNWLKERVGIQEPIYGPSAIRTVTAQTAEKPWTELTRDDLKWRVLNVTCVETQVFYFYTDSGHVAMVQIIYNCLAGIHVTYQLTCKVFYPDRAKTPLWTSDSLVNCELDETKTSLHADNCKIELSEDGSTYHIKASTSREAIVDIKLSRVAPGLMIGKDGTSYYGTDPKAPWGHMYHSFWPRCRAEGSIITQGGELSMAGRGIFIHAVQGMRPNLTASSWNFIDFQSESHSAFIMEFTTPPSYGTTTVTIGAISTDTEIICAGAQEKVVHTESKQDTEVGWPEPTSATFKWASKSDKPVSAELSGSIGPRADRVDVLAQIPQFLKIILAQAVGSKPFIYQYAPKMTLKLTQGGEEKEIEGVVYMEATYITEH